ncbi:hypothetical protein OC834_006733, partial [Tilletia horrida]
LNTSAQDAQTVAMPPLDPRSTPVSFDPLLLPPAPQSPQPLLPSPGPSPRAQVGTVAGFSALPALPALPAPPAPPAPPASPAPALEALPTTSAAAAAVTVPTAPAAWASPVAAAAAAATAAVVAAAEVLGSCAEFELPRLASVAELWRAWTSAGGGELSLGAMDEANDPRLRGSNKVKQQVYRWRKVITFIRSHACAEKAHIIAALDTILKARKGGLRLLAEELAKPGGAENWQSVVSEHLPDPNPGVVYP